MSTHYMQGPDWIILAVYFIILLFRFCINVLIGKIFKRISIEDISRLLFLI